MLVEAQRAAEAKSTHAMLPSSTCDVTSDIRLLLVEPPFSKRTDQS